MTNTAGPGVTVSSRPVPKHVQLPGGGNSFYDGHEFLIKFCLSWRAECRSIDTQDVHWAYGG